MHPAAVYGWPTRTEGNADRVAILLPGAAYVPARPLLHFARAVLVARGWTVQEIWWERPDIEQSKIGGWVVDQACAALDQEAGRDCLLVGKSLGTMAAPVAAERGLPAIWLTPLLHLPEVVEALRRAGKPTLLIGGTSDPSWKSDVARSLPAERLELPGADHGLESEDPVGSVELLKRTVATMDAFVRGLAS